MTLVDVYEETVGMSFPLDVELRVSDLVTIRHWGESGLIEAYQELLDVDAELEWYMEDRDRLQSLYDLFDQIESVCLFLFIKWRSIKLAFDLGVV